MKFIHIADIHLGVRPEAGKAYTQNRGKEIWNTFERVLEICENQQADLLLIAGDLFHRQPLLSELKEIDYLFSRLSHTQVVLIAGNHDYLKPDSYYRSYRWESKVFFLLDDKLDHVEFPELETCVYGLSYTQKEIAEPLYDHAFPMKKQKIEILLAHGGDEKHIPVRNKKLLELGYDYIAMGHIHRMTVIEPEKIIYAGSLEPTDTNDLGPHGYFEGEITDTRKKVQFVPFATRLYKQVLVHVEPDMAVREVRDQIAAAIREQGVENCYKVTLTGFCEQDLLIERDDVDVYGNVLELQNRTRPAYDFEKLQKANKGNLLGEYIERLKDCEEDSVEHMALYEGVRALMG